MPIHLTTTFAQHEPGKMYDIFDYTRAGNPTQEAFADLMAKIEFGKYCVTFSSGCGALSSLLHTFNAGDHFISINDVYGGSKRMFEHFKKFNLEYTMVDMIDCNHIEKAIKKNTKFIWIESPTNPLLNISDIPKIVEIAKKRNILVFVDNTFASPVLHSPLLLGADVSLISCTKYISGHCDIVAGVVVTNNKDIYDKLVFALKTNGSCLSPHDSYMLIRSLKTLKIRVEESCVNSQILANVLDDHPKITKVIYPGLKSHPNYELCKKIMRKPGGMLSFVIKGTYDDTKKFLKKLKHFTLAESLGGTKSLVSIPSKMTHASIDEKSRLALGITDTFIRLSVGCEDIHDLIDDILQALD